LSKPRSLAIPLAATKAPRKAKMSRVEKSVKTRQALFEAAAAVVGEHGYAGSMIATITARAQVSHGSFYNYFASRQELFDGLLPELGAQMLDFIRQETAGVTSALDREERSFRAFFTFLKVRPEFYRILYEAELFAPVAFKRHTDTIAAGYTRVLQRAAKQGEIRAKTSRDCESLAYMLMGVRHYLCMRYARQDGRTISIPEWVVRNYVDVVCGGVYLARTT
jgi:AcrR family transcriptional regulator